jgi:hypothetical protein
MGDVTRIAGDRDEDGRVGLDGLACEGARWLIAAALEAGVGEYVASFSEELDGNGRRLVVRNGRARERCVTVGSGALPIRAPRVNDRGIDEGTGEGKRFSSRILPCYARRSPKVSDVLPVLYLRGLSGGDFAPALRDLLGEDASGLSSSSISRLPSPGVRSTWRSSAGGLISFATPTCSPMGCTSVSAWVRTSACACW